MLCFSLSLIDSVHASAVHPAIRRCVQVSLLEGFPVCAAAPDRVPPAAGTLPFSVSPASEPNILSPLLSTLPVEPTFVVPHPEGYGAEARDSDIQKPSRCWYRSPPSRFCLRTMEFSPARGEHRSAFWWRRDLLFAKERSTQCFCALK
jgi:hypothetical protein